MICRIWKGYTAPENATAYETIVRTEVIPGIEACAIPGFLLIDLVRHTYASDVEFTALLWFTSFGAVKTFMGADYTKSHVPPRPKPS